MRKEEEHAGSRRRAGDGYGNSELDGALFSNATAAASSPPSTPPLTILVIKFSPTLLHLHNLPISQFLRARRARSKSDSSTLFPSVLPSRTRHPRKPDVTFDFLASHMRPAKSPTMSRKNRDMRGYESISTLPR